MTYIFVALIFIVCIVLGFIILVQNPQGGGLSGSIAGFSNQFMGVKKTTDVLENGTWLFTTILAILCITSSIFLKNALNNNNNENNKILQNLPTNSQPTAPANIPKGGGNTIPLNN